MPLPLKRNLGLLASQAPCSLSPIPLFTWNVFPFCLYEMLKLFMAYPESHSAMELFKKTQPSWHLPSVSAGSCTFATTCDALFWGVSGLSLLPCLLWVILVSITRSYFPEDKDSVLYISESYQPYNLAHIRWVGNTVWIINFIWTLSKVTRLICAGVT